MLVSYLTLTRCIPLCLELCASLFISGVSWKSSWPGVMTVFACLFFWESYLNIWDDHKSKTQWTNQVTWHENICKSPPSASLCSILPTFDTCARYTPINEYWSSYICILESLCWLFILGFNNNNNNISSHAILFLPQLNTFHMIQ